VRHVYECPLRWADLDLLGHVNNVTYVDYLQEARVDMLLTHAPDARASDLAEAVVVARHEVEYAAPLGFRSGTVSIESWVTEIRAASFTMAYEVVDETDAGRVVYLRAKSVLSPYVFAEERPRRLRPEEKETLSLFLDDDPLPERVRLGERRRVPQGHYPLRVRFSDVDVYGHVNNVEYFTFFQEGRIDYLTRVAGTEFGSEHHVPIVLARMDVDYRRPILFRPEPYELQSWVADVGRSSYTIESEILDGDDLLSRARAVMVTFDPVTQRAAPMPEVYRELLAAEAGGGAVTRTS